MLATPACTKNASVATSVPLERTPPVNEPVVTVWLKPPKSKLPPATVSEPAILSRSSPPNFKVPALTVVPPVYVFRLNSVESPPEALPSLTFSSAPAPVREVAKLPAATS